MKTHSNFMRDLTEKSFVFTGEVEPKKTTSLERVIEAAKVLKGYVSAINVTDNPAGLAHMNSLVPSYIIQERVGIEAIYQVTCRDRNRLAIFSDLLAAYALGIRNILALTGDHTSFGDMPEAKPVFDLDSQQLVYMIRKMVDEGTDLNGNPIENPPKFHVGVAASPAATPLEPELLKLERKVKLGAEFVQTQAVFDIQIAKNFLKESSHLNIPILIGIAPLKSIKMAKWMKKNLPGIIIPEEYMEKLEKSESKEEIFEVNVEYFSGMIKELRKTTHARGVHIMAIGYEHIVPEIIRRST